MGELQKKKKIEGGKVFWKDWVSEVQTMVTGALLKQKGRDIDIDNLKGKNNDPETISYRHEVRKSSSHSYVP